MKQNLFKNLPSDVTIEILSRLPIPSVACCKCVCKPWLHFVETREFGKSHLSKSVPNLLVIQFLVGSKLCRIFEFESPSFLNLVAKFSLTYHGEIHGSVEGLVFVCNKGLTTEGHFICNPITCEYIKLNSPKKFNCSAAAYGFGMSKISGEYKVVRISHDECEVYTLGTGFWRKIIAPPHRFYSNANPFSSVTCNTGAFLNGILHWLVRDVNGCAQICCFDLETETFSHFPCPLLDQAVLCVLGNSLCLCDTTKSAAEIVIWSFEERGDEKIWEKVLVICKPRVGFLSGLLYPLKLFKDGDVLFKLDSISFLLNYSEKDKSLAFLSNYSEKDKSLAFEMLYSGHGAIIFTPSFLSLKCFDMENVRTFWFNAA